MYTHSRKKPFLPMSEEIGIWISISFRRKDADIDT